VSAVWLALYLLCAGAWHKPVMGPREPLLLGVETHSMIIRNDVVMEETTPILSPYRKPNGSHRSNPIEIKSPLQGLPYLVSKDGVIQDFKDRQRVNRALRWTLAIMFWMGLWAITLRGILDYRRGNLLCLNAAMACSLQLIIMGTGVFVIGKYVPERMLGPLVLMEPRVREKF